MNEVNHERKPRLTFSKAILLVLVLAVFAFAYTNDMFKLKSESKILNPKQETQISLSQRIMSWFGMDASAGRKTSILTQEVIQEESSVVNVVENVSPSVVSVIVRRVGFDFFSGPFESEDGIGTGFIVDSTGLIITNSHVVSDSEGEYSVVTVDGETYEVIDIHLDEPTDLAIIEIVAQDLPEVVLGDSDTLRVGQSAIAIGNALGRFSNTVTVGVVSGVARELTAFGGRGDLKTYESAIQTDAALNPGNSGGPLLNSAGQVIGINVATSAGADNIGFAIPVNTLKPILSGFLEEGRIIRPYIGVSYTVISAAMSELRGFPEGAFISRVVPNSPAFNAGIQRGDIITVFDGTLVTEEVSLSELIRDKDVGDSISLEVVRGEESLNLTLVLEEAPDSIQ